MIDVVEDARHVEGDEIIVHVLQLGPGDDRHIHHAFPDELHDFGLRSEDLIGIDVEAEVFLALIEELREALERDV